MAQLIKNNKQKKVSRAKGFTLVEMLVAVSIFVIVIISATAIFIAVMQSQSKSNVQRQTMQDARYAMEVITREARMATGDSTNAPIKLSSDQTQLIITNIPKGSSSSVVRTFYLSNNVLYVREGPSGTPEPLTSDNISVTSFVLQNANNSDPQAGNPNWQPTHQPAVTITINTQQGSGSKISEKSTTTLRTTISSRDYLYTQ